MHGPGSLESSARGLWKELAPEPDRWLGTLRITIAALLVAVVMLAFRMPFLSIGPYLVFILSQRDMLLTRAASVLAVLVGVLACLLVYFVVFVAWDVAWLRFSLLAAIFYGGYYLMRILAEPRIILGALVMLALFASSFDTVPYPNGLLDQLGWIWAIFGLIFVATFLTQWMLRQPTALELLRAQMRRILVAAEAACVGAAFNRPPAGVAPLARDREEAAARIRTLAGTRFLSPAEADRCRDLLQGCNALLAAATRENIADAEEKSRLRAAAGWLRKLRFRVLLGNEAKLDPPAGLPLTPALREAFEKLAQAGSALTRPFDFAPKPHAKPSLVPADWASNPLYASFATRAALAIMGCYVFMTLTDWGDIHTCMITCVVTALAAAEERVLKQKLRIVGAVIGGILGTGAVVFVIPRFDSLVALLFVLAAGTALAAWVALGGRRMSYAGWQIALAFYMTILQDPHPVTKLDAIWDRWVGIVVGILAMRTAFALPPLHGLFAQTPRNRTVLSKGSL